jgi:hypothetical protein
MVGGIDFEHVAADPAARLCERDVAVVSDGTDNRSHDDSVNRLEKSLSLACRTVVDDGVPRSLVGCRGQIRSGRRRRQLAT